MDCNVKVPTTRAALKSFNKIVSAAEEILYEKGYFNSTINDIAAAAELSVGTFYIYFNSKYTMYVYILKKYARELKMALAESVKDCKTRLEKETVGLRTFILHTIENPRCYNLIWESLYVDRNLFFGYYKSFAESYTRGLERAVDEIDSRLDLETVSYCLMGIANFVGLQAITSDEITEEHIDRMVETAKIMMLNGIFRNTVAE